MSRPTDFWSRRKAGVEAERQALEAEASAPPPLDERSDDDILAELNLAAPETLDTPEAVKDFLTHDLPERIRARALRQLWRTNPVLANLDGLVDYGEDFTDAATVMDKMETVYQVGKGMLTAFLDDDTPTDDDTPRANHEDGTDGDPTADEDTPLIAAAQPQALPDPDPAPVAMPQRRMRFAFQEAG